METFWIIAGGVAGGGLGWLYGRRFMKRDEDKGSNQQSEEHT